MRAGATMPVVAGPPVTFRGRTYLDASLTEPISVPIAETDGCTHALVLTRPTETARKTTAFDRAYVLPRLRRLSPALADLYSGAESRMQALLSCIAAGMGPAGTAAVMGIRPAPSVSKLNGPLIA